MSRKLYLANVAHEFLPRRAIRALYAMGWDTSGNLYGPDRPLEAFQPDVVVYVPTSRPDAIGPPRVDDSRDVPLLIWALYPDQLMGWDVRTNSFGKKLAPLADVLFEPAAIRLASSRFSKALLERATGLDDFRVCLLGIDTTGILNALGRRPVKDHPKTVLWHHRWSTDKNLAQAFDVLLELAPRYRDVTFLLGRSGDWQQLHVSVGLRRHHRRFEAAARRHENLHMVPRFRTRRAFWAFLRHVDIGFSTAYHETFGLTMLEQGCAGVACIAPNHQAYPEVHTGALLVPHSDIASAIGSLIENADAWREVARSSQLNALNYDVDTVGRAIADLARAAVARE